MRILFYIATFLVAQWSTAKEQNTHCSRTEFIYFNCQVKGSTKIASLCAAEPKGAFKGYIQYRFGKIGNIEFKFPESTTEKDMLNKFYAHSGRTFDFSLYNSDISFINKEYAYQLYYGKDNQSGQWNESSGIMVWNVHRRDKVKDFECKNTNAGEQLPPSHIIENNSSKDFQWQKQIW